MQHGVWDSNLGFTSTLGVGNWALSFGDEEDEEKIIVKLSSTVRAAIKTIATSMMTTLIGAEQSGGGHVWLFKN